MSQEATGNTRVDMVTEADVVTETLEGTQEVLDHSPTTKDGLVWVVD